MVSAAALGLVKAEPRSVASVSGSSRRAGEDEVADVGGELRALLEQQRVMALHDLACSVSASAKASSVG